MPQVGNKEYPYTKAGIAEAKAESQRTGIKIRGPKRGYKRVVKHNPVAAGGGAQVHEAANLVPVVPAGTGGVPANPDKFSGR